MYNLLELNGMKVAELKTVADKLGITQTEKLKKQDLVYKILDEQRIQSEASAPAEVELLRMVAVRLSPKVYEVTSGQRRYLHLAAVFACNFANHMYALSSHILEKQGIPFEVMLPLIDETAGKVHELSPTQAQTGPAVRYDENVISKHLEMLADEESLQELYEKISKSIHDLPLSVIQTNKERKNS